MFSYFLLIQIEILSKCFVQVRDSLGLMLTDQIQFSYTKFADCLL